MGKTIKMISSYISMNATPYFKDNNWRVINREKTNWGYTIVYSIFKRNLAMQRLAIILILILLVSNVQGQKYYSFPDTGAIWSVNLNKFTVSGDTLIKGIKYKRYFKTLGDSIFSFEKASYFAALREDSSKRIWAISKDSTTEKLLYDFSLKTGDTAVVYLFDFFRFRNDSLQIKIAKIDSIQINLSFHKRYKISSIWGDTGMPEYWIEGIGSTMGIFNSGSSTLRIADIGFPELLCFYENGYTKYFNGNNTCYRPIWVGVNSQKIGKSECKFYPNPFNDNSTLHLSTVNSLNLVLDIYDAYGSLIKTYQIKLNDFIIDRTGIESGLYIYKLIDKNFVTNTEKIIIQ